MSEELLKQEVATEQTYVDRVYVQLEASARNAQQLAKEGHERGKLEHEGGLVERDAMVFQAARRIAQLDAAHEGLVFGRLDLIADIDKEPRYIGRIGLRDANRDSLLIDWRAPAASVFYQATAAEPQGVPRGEDEDWQCQATAPDTARQLQAIDFGQANVNDGGVKCLAQQHIFGTFSAADPVHRITGITESQLDAAGHHHIIFNQKKSHKKEVV